MPGLHYKIFHYLTFLVSTLLILMIFAEPSKSNTKENLGKSINSPYAELLPVISPDGKTLYFCRKSHPDNIGIDKWEDIWVSYLQEDGTWTEAENIGPPLNNEFPNAVCAITVDGNSILLAQTYKPDGTMEKGPSISNRTKDGWGFPEKQTIINYYNNSPYATFSISPDRRKLFLGIERDETYGGLDLYISFLIDGNLWSEPVNLGHIINTPQDENSPFLAADNRTLYFSSKGHGGYGDYDIFYTRRIDSSWTNWSKPVNLGKHFNTPNGDANLVLPASGEYAYFTSTDNSIGNWDIFRIKMPEAAKPKPAVLVSGKVLNAFDNQPVDATVIYELVTDPNDYGMARSDPNTGEFKVALPAGLKYAFRSEKDGFIFLTETIDLENVRNYKEIETQIDSYPRDSLQTYNSEFDEYSYLVFFKHAKANIDFAFYTELEKVVDFLKENVMFNILISGFADSTGTDEINNTLSEKRALAVVNYLKQKGIAHNRISHNYFGSRFPIADNSSETGRQLNRRVEFVLTRKKFQD